MRKNLLRKTIYDDLLGLVAEEGIYASGKEEIYGCIFGRDSAVTILKILKACANRSTAFSLNTIELYAACRKTLITLADLQGRTVNHESGEEPGKFIHEHRRSNFEHLARKNWFVYPDGVLRNYDSIDSTPLSLIAIYRYWKQTKDWEFLYRVLPSVEAGLNWIMTWGDSDRDYLIEYKIPNNRTGSGLLVHSWTDSHESLQRADGSMPIYPIAPVEVQGYAWLALKLWSHFYRDHRDQASLPDFYLKLRNHAKAIKRNFNKNFIFKSEGYYYAAQALDGNNRRIETITGNPLLLLWASYRSNGKTYSIIKRKYVKDLVARAFMPDLFDRDAGIRTMSKKSPTFNPKETSYHNGSFWPKLNGMAHEGLRKWGFIEEAKKLKRATIKPIRFFGSPIELYIKNEKGLYQEFKGANGQVSCRIQAWSAASVLDLLTIKRERKRAYRQKTSVEN